MSRVFTRKSVGLKFRFSKGTRFVNSLVGLVLFFVAGLTHAQILVAVDDGFGIPSNVLFGEPFIVEEPGVLKNDIFDAEDGEGEQTEFGGTALLLTDVADGTLTCPNDGALKLCADGSFRYEPGLGFSGIDSFTYQVTFAGEVDTATVTLTACTEVKDGDGNRLGLFSCWKEAAYRAKLVELGYLTFEEGFEGAAWDSVRWPNSAPEIVSQGLRWTTNHPVTNNITTGSGAARTGFFGAFDPNHGFATGTENECDVDDPPENCLYHDGLSGSIQPGGDPVHSLLRGAGGYLDSNTGGGNIDIILYGGTHPADVGTPINVGKLPHAAHQFFGVIDTTASGFTGFEFREVDGKIGQARFVFGDDFTIATNADCLATGYEIPAGKWAKFALPCNPAQSNNPEKVFTGANTDSLVPGDYGNTWVVFRRNASTPVYEELGITEQMNKGIGYWVFSTKATTVGVSGSLQDIIDIKLVGVSGTGRDNYVGHNQNVSVDWTQVQVVKGSTVYNYGEYDTLNDGVYDCDTPVKAGCIMSRKMNKWNGSAYQVFDGITLNRLGSLDPFDAFWVQAFEADIKLSIPVVAAGSTVASAAPSLSAVEGSISISTEDNTNKKPKKAKKPKKPSFEPWYISLIASSGDMEDPGNVLGQMDTATEGNDPHDLEEPAPFGDKYLSILFTNPLFEQLNWGFTTDFRAMTKHPRGVWPFVVKTHAGSREVTIRWEGKDELFKDAWLVDEENGEFIQAKAGESYTFEIEGGEHHFRFEVGE